MASKYFIPITTQKNSNIYNNSNNGVGLLISSFTYNKYQFKFSFPPPINVTGKKRFPFLFHVLDTKVKGFPFILYSKTESLGPQL